MWGEQPSVSIMIKDDEAAGVVVSHTTLNLEEGQTGQYTLSLTQEPATGESVTITVQRPAGVTVAPTIPVVLTASNWESGVVVQVTPQADNVTETDETATVQHQVSSAGGGTDAKFGSATTATAVTINVSDAPSS